MLTKGGEKPSTVEELKQRSAAEAHDHADDLWGSDSDINDEDLNREEAEWFDPDEDENDTEWAQKQRQGRQSDAILSCPGCLTTCCIDCQQHAYRQNQYRAMFVTNCRVDFTQSVAIEIENSAQSKKRARGKDDERAKKDEKEREILYPVLCEVPKESEPTQRKLSKQPTMKSLNLSQRPVPGKKSGIALTATAQLITTSRKFQMLMDSTNDGKLAVILWTAAFTSMHEEALQRFQLMARLRSDLATFAVCDVDDLPELAREYAVHDLPSFQIFQDGSLIERLQGFSSMQQILPALEYHSDLKAEAESIPSSSESFASISPAESFETPFDITSLSHPSTAESMSTLSLDTAVSTCPSEWATESLRKLSGATSASAKSRRTYLPRFTEGKTISLEARNWRIPAFGLYKFQ